MGQLLSSSDGSQQSIPNGNNTTTQPNLTSEAYGPTDTAIEPTGTNTSVSNDLSGTINNYFNDLSNSNTTTSPVSSDPSSHNETISTTFPNDGEFSLNLFGTVLYPFRWLTLATLTSWLGPLSSLAMIIGCVLPYAPQYLSIHRAKSCSGFSTFVCLTLIIANILRIAFWFGHRFELPLLIQSVIMILAQILLLELCVRVKRQQAMNSVPLVRRTLLSFNPKHFWRWTDLTSYLVFILFITGLLGVAVYYFIDNCPFIESLGYCALVTESMLGLPQVIRNYRKKSVEGMSLSMVLMWLAGDTFKTGYFISNAVPYQFWLCGLLQITIDIVILFQVCLFKQKAPIKGDQSDKGSPREMVAL